MIRIVSKKSIRRNSAENPSATKGKKLKPSKTTIFNQSGISNSQLNG